MTAKDEFETKVAEQQAQGHTRENAVRRVVKANPELQQRLIDEANQAGR